MRLEDMKNDIPETPEFIHAMIQKEVYKQLQDAKVVEIHTRGRKWTCTRVAAAVAVCILASSTIAYAGVKLYQVFIEKQGAYSVITGINADDSIGTIHLPETIHDIDIATSYIPEGMEWTDEVHLQYSEQKWIGGFSFSSVLLDDDDLGKVMEDKNVIESDERMFGDYNGVYLKYHDLVSDGSFNQKIYLLCPDVYRVITVYIGDNVTKEDAIKVAENLVITEKDTMIETDGLYTWSDLISPEEVETEVDTVITSITTDKLPVHQIGDKFEVTAHSMDEAGHWEDSKISVYVDEVLIEDNLEIFGQNQIPEEWMNAVGTDGKLVYNTRSFIKSGDGIDSVDEIIKTESIEQKLVYATVTYTNETDKDINHMLYAGSLMLMDYTEGVYHICDSVELSEKDYNRIIEDGIARIGEMTYYSVSEEFGNGGNYIPSLRAGESIQVNMAWIVNEDVLDKMYLNLSGDFGTYELTDSMLEVGVVNICQYRE